jgi:NACHT domain
MKASDISRFKKERFLKNLSEDDFRDLVVRPFYLRSGFQDGRDLCGPSEHGKDALFLEKDSLEMDVWVAVQTKKGNLNLASTAGANLIAAVIQCRTALEASYVVISNKEKIRPSRVFLCVSGKINNAAKEHILEEVRSPNISFLDADDLIPRIDRIMPELWLGIDSELLPYFDAIEKLVTGGAATLIGQRSDGVTAPAADDDLFVALTLFRQSVRFKTVSGKVTEHPEFIELPITSVTNIKARRVLIMGEGGSGKTTGLLRVALELARKGVATDKYIVPILLKATELSKIKPSNLASYCDEVAQSILASKKSCFSSKDLTDGRVILLVDGLDEVASIEDKKWVSQTLVNFSAHYPKCQIIATARPYKVFADLHELKTFEEYRVSPISWKQAEKIVQAVGQRKKLPTKTSNELMRRLEKIHGFELNPLLVTVFAATTDYSKQDLPANITELFKKFTELMLGRWDEEKGLSLQYQAPLKDFILQRLAFHMHTMNTTAISREEAERIACLVLQERGHDVNGNGLLSEIFDRSGLFRIHGGTIEFRHHLLQEFFAGRGIPSPDYISKVIASEWWKRAVVFYFGENPQSISLLKSAMQSVDAPSATGMIEAASTVGLALQACYLSPVSEKMEVWKWVVDVLGKNHRLAGAQEDPEGKFPLAHYFNAYLYVRDSVASSHLKQNLSQLQLWAKENYINDINNIQNDERLFWLLVGLIESGDLAEAEIVIKNNSPKNTEQLLAIFLGCHLAKEVRPLDKFQKEHAKAICDKLLIKTQPYAQLLFKEYGTLLLEYRNGKIDTSVE